MEKKDESVFMGEAIDLAEKGIGHTRPNPPVGAVVVKDGKVIGRGWHRKCGGDHAEVAAMRNALRKVKSKSEKGKSAEGKPLSGCELYVTLEPCSKAGRVGACTDAIIAAGIKRVVYGVADPNPKNRGKAKRALAKAGVACEMLRDDVLVPFARHLIAPFAKHVTTGLPYVTVKLAMSLDGKICDNWGDAKWVSSAVMRRRTGALRERVDVVMVGAETIRKDNPSLLCHTKRNDDLWRAIVSKSGRLPKKAQVFTDKAKDRTLVYRDAVEAVRDLGRRGFLHVLCEGGLKLATSLAEAGLVDAWTTVLVRKVIGTKRIGRATLVRKVVCLLD